MTSRAGADARRRLLTRADRGRADQIAPPLYAARFDDRWVLLDAARGDYLTISDEPSAPASQGGASASPVVLGEALARTDLAGRPIVIVAPPPDVSETQTPLPPSVKSATAGDVILVALALVATAWDLSRPFPELVRPRRLRGRSRGDDEAARQSALFSRLLVWSPWQGQCLFRSRWLLRYLQLRGCAADWVFGVRGWPFRAHCWVRQGATLLNEQPGEVLAYRELAVF